MKQTDIDSFIKYLSRYKRDNKNNRLSIVEYIINEYEIDPIKDLWDFGMLYRIMEEFFAFTGKEDRWPHHTVYTGKEKDKPLEIRYPDIKIKRAPFDREYHKKMWNYIIKELESVKENAYIYGNVLSYYKNAEEWMKDDTDAYEAIGDAIDPFCDYMDSWMESATKRCLQYRDKKYPAQAKKDFGDPDGFGQKCLQETEKLNGFDICDSNDNLHCLCCPFACKNRTCAGYGTPYSWEFTDAVFHLDKERAIDIAKRIRDMEIKENVILK